MSRVTFSPAAIADIDGMWDYTAEMWGVDQADRYTDDIRDACNALAAGTKQGRTVDVRGGYLKYSVGKHFVFFWAASDLVDFIKARQRILHEVTETTEKKKRLNAEIEESPYKRIKMKSVEEGRSISDITRDLWSEYLSK